MGYIGNHFKQRSFLNLVLILTLISGIVFLVFAWVPYKQAERRLSFVRQQATAGQSSLREFQNMMHALTQSSKSWHQFDVAYRLYGPSGVVATMLKTLHSDSLTALPQNDPGQPRLQASIFYPWLNKRVQSDFQLETTVTKKQLNELTTTLDKQQVIGQALINLLVFDPSKHLDPLLAAKDEKTLATKLNSINEAIGQTELSLKNMSGNDRSTGKILEAVKFQHQKIITIIDQVAQGDYADAKRTKEQMIVSLEGFRKEFERLDFPLSAQTKQHLATIDRLAQDYENLLKKIDAFQKKYFQL